MMKSAFLVLLLAILVPVWSVSAAPQNATAEKAAAAKAVPEKNAAGTSAMAEAEPPPVDVTLSNLLDSIQRTEASLDAARAELLKASTEQQRISIQATIDQLLANLSRQRENLRSLSTGLPAEELPANGEGGIDWRDEILEMLWPMLNELKKLTARPRELDALRTEIDLKSKKLPAIDTAIGRLSTLADETKDRQLAAYLTKQREKLEERLQDLQSDLQVAQLKLNQKLSEESSLTDTVRNVFRDFFQNRGKNLLAAVAAFLGIYFLLRFFHNRVRKQFKLHEPGAGFSLRLADLIAAIVIFLIGLTAALAVLYASGDWVLLGLTLILLFGVLWSAKEGIPEFFEQIKLLLNIGTVREGERIIHNGLPWRVERLHYYTRLTNPALTGGLLRVRLTDLVDASSRPYSPHEPWFPCEEDHWVLLSDGTYGRVMRQTPETVQVLSLATMKTYQTTDFLALSPKNLSLGFGLFISFGLDYAQQAEITSAIPETLKDAVAETLENTRKGEMLRGLLVEFGEAGDSSLNVVVYATFDGAAADMYYPLSRAINKALVDACTANGWSIPFPQVTLSARPGELEVAQAPGDSGGTA